jgi:hypothetical protein
MRSIAEMSPDVGRGANFNGPSTVNSAGLPEVDAPEAGDADGDEPPPGAQAARKMENENASAFRDDERFTESSDFAES